MKSKMKLPNWFKKFEEEIKSKLNQNKKKWKQFVEIILYQISLDWKENILYRCAIKDIEKQMKELIYVFEGFKKAKENFKQKLASMNIKQISKMKVDFKFI